LKSEKGHIGRIEGVPEEMGTFPIRITLTDRNTNKTVEQTLDLRVKDDIAVHTYKDGDDDWNTISSSSAIILSKKGKKTVFIGVQGNAPNYTWSISGDSRVKLDKNCMDKDTPEYKEYSCLVTDYEGAEIITVEDLVVVIDDGLGNREELEFTNVVLEQDMCKTPMTVKASKVKVPYGHYSISFKIEGGMPPYHYFKYDPVTDMEYGVNDFSDSEINISDDANLVPGADLEYAMNADEAIHYNFYDSCGTYTYDNSITTELGLFFQDETLLFKSYYFKSELVITADDTDGDGDSPMYMALLNKDNDVMAKWASGNDELSINLDIYNKDHGNGQYWKVVDQPHTKFSNNQTRVTDIDRVQFRVSSHGNDLFEEVDIAFQRYIIKLPNWCGTAQNMPTGEYECTNNIFCSYHYPISWRIRDGAEDDCSGDYIFRNYVETKT